jgi:hypothetical protein
LSLALGLMLGPIGVLVAALLTMTPDAIVAREREVLALRAAGAPRVLGVSSLADVDRRLAELGQGVREGQVTDGAAIAKRAELMAARAALELAAKVEPPPVG